MPEITKTALPQITASNAVQGAASRARDASASTAEGTDAFSRALDQQLSNRREAARSEESARARDAGSEPARDKAEASSGSGRTEKAEKTEKTDKAEKEGGARESAARDSADTEGKAVATDAGSSVHVAAGIAALLPGLASGAVKNAAGTGPDGKPADVPAVATGPVRRQAGAGLPIATPVEGGGRQQDGAGQEGGDVLADASAEPAPDAKAVMLPGAETKAEGAATEALSRKTASQVNIEAEGDAFSLPAVPAREAAALAVSATDGAAVAPVTTGSDGTAAQMTMQAGVAARPQGTATHQPMPAYIATPAGQPGWAEDVGNRVVLLAGRDESAAELILTPPHLGRVEVSLRVNGEHTTAHFVAATPAARDALDQAMPRLREVLAEAGIALGDANVNTQAQQQRGENGSGHYRPRYGNDTTGESPVAASQTWLRQSDGLIDTFA